MAENKKIKVKLVPVENTPGYHLARDQEIEVQIEDSGKQHLNSRKAFFLACMVADCNPVNYSASTLEI